MPDITLDAEARPRAGSAESRRLRRDGRIPATVYGHGIEPLSVSVDARELRLALSTEAGLNQLLELRVGGSRHLTLARELQRHPVRRTVAHVDFQVVRRDEVIRAEVPVVVTGEAVAVRRAGGVIEHVLANLTVHSTPDRIPAEITVDVSQLGPGDSIRVGQLPLPAGVTTDLDPEETVVVATLGLPEPAEALEGEGGEGPATAEGGDGAGAVAAPPVSESGGTGED